MAPVFTAQIPAEFKGIIIPVLGTMETQPAGAQKKEWAFFSPTPSVHLNMYNYYNNCLLYGHT